MRHPEQSEGSRDSSPVKQGQNDAKKIMPTLNVLINPTKSLREKSVEVALNDIKSDQIQTLIKEMIEIMIKKDGVGIAAVQVGINKRIIIVDIGDGPKAYVNPEITSRSLRKIESEEGCLSVPGVYGIVKRHKKIKVRALDQDGNQVKFNLVNFPAIVFQHEIDHTNGILFIDKAEKLTQESKM